MVAMAFSSLATLVKDMLNNLCEGQGEGEGEGARWEKDDGEERRGEQRRHKQECWPIQPSLGLRLWLADGPLFRTRSLGQEEIQPNSRRVLAGALPHRHTPDSDFKLEFKVQDSKMSTFVLPIMLFCLRNPVQAQLSMSKDTLTCVRHCFGINLTCFVEATKI